MDDIRGSAKVFASTAIVILFSLTRNEDLDE